MSASGIADKFNVVYPVLEPQLMEHIHLLAPQLTEKHTALIKDEMAIAFDESLADYFNDLVPLYDEAFTHEEIDAALAFMDSDIGKKLRSKSLAISQAVGTLSVEWGRRLAERTNARAMEKLRELGYEF